MNRKPLLRSAWYAALMLTAALACAACAKPQTAVVTDSQAPAGIRHAAGARVNGVAIPRKTITEQADRLMAAEGSSRPATREEAEQKGLEAAIFLELAYQEAVRQQLHLDEGSVDKTMQKLKSRLGDDDAFKAFLAKENMTEPELRAVIERGLLIQLVFDREVSARISIPEEDLRKEYDSHKDLFAIPGKVKVKDVVLFLDQNDAASAAKANGILDRIRADKDRDASHLVPDGTFVVREVELDKDKNAVLYTAAQTMKPGDLSPVLHTDDSLHIIQLVELIPRKQLAFEKVKGTILLKLRADAMKVRRQTWEAELRRGAKIEYVDAAGLPLQQ